MKLLPQSLEHLRLKARLPLGYVVEFSYRDGRMQCEWDPEHSRIRSPRHRRKFHEAYCAARDEYLQNVANMVGGAIVIEDQTADGDTGVVAVKPETRQ